MVSNLVEWPSDREPFYYAIQRIHRAVESRSLWYEGSYAKVIGEGLDAIVRRPPCVPIMVADLRVALEILDLLNEIGWDRMHKLLMEAKRGSRGWVDLDLYARFEALIHLMEEW